jgi:transcriptional regulator with XRE-family HTH domain
MNRREGDMVRITSVGARIAARRTALGLSQAQLAERAGCAQPRISAWERGRREPSLLNLVRLASALGVSTDWLLRDIRAT